MISKNRIKAIHSLSLKKNRDELRLFVAEGSKTVCDLLSHFQCAYIAATENWLQNHPLPAGTACDTVTPEELQRASFLQHPQEVLAVFNKLSNEATPFHLPQEQLCLGLDDIQDPGNLGTIIRLADWFGIHHIFCSPSTADAFSPKTVQATMGALARVNLHYTPLLPFLEKLQASDTPIYGTFLHGTNIYQTDLTQHGLILMGNEGNGISPALEPYCSYRLFIPPYPQGQPTSESLNVAIATAIICAEFRRRE